MKKVFILYCLLFTSYFCIAQMQPADSLPGTYAGQYWFKQPITNPWTITADTVYVTNIDSVNCAVQAHATHFSLIPPQPPDTNYYTDYYSCNGTAPANFYVKFYSGDSLRLINDNEPQPPPNPAISYRFFGKRISNKITAENEVINAKQIKVYPNPAKDKIFIDVKNKNTTMSLFDICGKEVLKTQNKEIDISALPEGIYFFQVKTAEGIAVKKIILSR